MGAGTRCRNPQVTTQPERILSVSHGWLPALLAGKRVPYNKVWTPAAAEQEYWAKYRQQQVEEARAGMTSGEAIAAIRRPARRDAGCVPCRPQFNVPVQRRAAQRTVHFNRLLDRAKSV